MKCPKCGFNSFECLTACKKCSYDLTAFKETHGLKPIVLQQETRNAMVAAMAAEAARNAVAQQPAEQPNDMFSFDIPDTVPPISSPKATADDFFNFSEKPSATLNEGFGNFSFDDEQPIKKPATMDDAFSSLLESTPRSNSGEAASPPATASAATTAGSPGEFELDTFSWDEAPESTAASEKKPVDDFNSLFGEISDSTKK